jgi:hypothetical protein
MEEKTAKELVKQLTRIANALEKSNVIEEVREKRRIKLEKLEEKNLRANLKENTKVDPEQVIKSKPSYKPYMR